MLERPKTEDTSPLYKMDSNNSSDVTMGNQQERLEAKVVCRLCNKEFWLICGRHLQQNHQIQTVEAYRIMFPDAPIYSKKYLRDHLAGAKGSGTKSSNTKLLRYGTRSPGIEKSYCFGKGESNPMKNTEIVEKCRASFVKNVEEKYGFAITNPLQVPGAKENRKRTLLKNWGVDEPMKHPDIKRRARTQRAKGEMNKIESNLFSLAPDKLKYVGDSSFWLTIGDKLINPDFLVEPFQETKKVVEVYGEYWHHKDDPQKRINLFKTVEIDCIIFWGKELHQKIKLPASKIRLEAFLKSSETTRSTPTVGDDIVRPSAKSEELAEML